MALKVRWLKNSLHGAPGRREEGQIETNDDDLCHAWVKAGLAEFVEEEPETKAVHQAPVDKAVKGKK